jgi:HD-like signal output (HDOD) protein
VQGKKLRRLLNRIDIPTLPAVVMEVNCVLKDDNQGIEVRSEAMWSDAVLTTKVLRSEVEVFGIIRKIKHDFETLTSSWQI